MAEAAAHAEVKERHELTTHWKRWVLCLREEEEPFTQFVCMIETWIEEQMQMCFVSKIDFDELNQFSSWLKTVSNRLGSHKYTFNN